MCPASCLSAGRREFFMIVKKLIVIVIVVLVVKTVMVGRFAVFKDIVIVALTDINSEADVPAVDIASDKKDSFSVFRFVVENEFFFFSVFGNRHFQFEFVVFLFVFDFRLFNQFVF